MIKQQRLVTGALLLTAAGFAGRLIGFFYKIFLSHAIGAQGLGIYQMIFPLFSLAYALCVSGIQTALTRCISERKAVRDLKGAQDFLIAGCLFTLLLSLAVFAALYLGCEWFCLNILKQPACIPLIKLMAWTIPFGALHICMVSWYFASQNTCLPSVAQLLEQLIRVSASLIFWRLMLQKGMEPTPILAVAGTAVSEVFSFAFLLFFLQKDLRADGYRIRPSSWKHCLTHIVLLAAPLTANRLFLNLLRSAESLLIPLSLQQYGLSSADALSVYGILTGMALPLLLFPSAITQSFSVVLLPAVSGSRTKGETCRIALMVERTLRGGLLLGVYCFGVFFTCGDSLGMLLFHNAQAGVMIRVLALLCPFLYLSASLSGILHGLGKTSHFFLYSLTAQTLRLLCVLLLTPRIGIIGCLLGIMGNELLLVILCSFTLSREGVLRFSAKNALIRPVFFLILSVGCSRFVSSLPFWNRRNLLWQTGISLCVITLTYCGLSLAFGLIHLSKIRPRLYFHVDKK